MKNKVIYVHGKGGNAGEADHYKPLFGDSEVIGFDYRSQTPWQAREEFTAFFDVQKRDCRSLTLIANSIGAFFSMISLSEKLVDNALFISPIVDMERLIQDMMTWAHVTEKELCSRKEIRTEFGETLSWEYLCYVRNNPPEWKVPTCVLYGEEDSLTSWETISDFARKTGASLTVMDGGEHWFHTEDQMQFLDNWIKKLRNDHIIMKDGTECP